MRGKGEALYRAAFSDLRMYPEDLAAKLDDLSLPHEERRQAKEALNRREWDAFMRFRPSASGDTALYWGKYLQYLDTLSPAELQSDRYRGQRAIAVMFYERATGEKAEDPVDRSRMQDPILLLFQELEALDFQVEDAEGFRARYGELIASMTDGVGGPRVQEAADQALARLDALQRVLGAARTGDETALGWLDALASDQSSLSGFLDYAASLPIPKPAAAGARSAAQ